ncbi:MAG: hypothetical protein SPH83_02700 [Treponema sp.]|nr:hypothetical protein [Spirochaetales bacterium]MDY6189389.1 hypothetical protein [Treponema sp.]
MFNDIESDFWKEQLSAMQKNNLLRKDSDKLYMSDCEEKFEEFKLLHPELVIESTCGANYCSLEFFVTQDIKLRLFVQNQTKITFLQRTDDDLIKIADAKFPNNPFKEIEEFLSHKTELNKQILKLKEDSLIIQKRQRFAIFFIEAYLEKKISETFFWKIQKNKQNLSVEVQRINKTKEVFSFEVNLEQEIKTQIDFQIKRITNL